MHKTWVTRTLFVSLIFVFLFALFNVVVDPFAMFNLIKIKHFNAEKYEVDSHLRLTKSQKLYSNNFDTIITGTSRTEKGLRTGFFRKDGLSAYNAAVGSETIYEAYKFIKLAIEKSKTKNVILGLDFCAFNGREIYNSDFNEEYFEDPLIFRFRSLLSKDMLDSSIKTLKKQNERSEYNEFGENYILEEPGYMPKNKIHDFEYSNSEWRDIYKNFTFEYANGDSTFKYYEAILNVCYANNIKLTMFISPVHATHLESLIASCGIDKYEQWLANLVEINERMSHKYKTKTFDIFDFGGYNCYTTEPISNNMQYYYEGSHYTPKLGDKMIEKMFTKTQENEDDFGLAMNISNIGMRINRFESLREKWLTYNKSDGKL